MSHANWVPTQSFHGGKNMPGDLVPFPISHHGRDGVSFVESVATRMLELPPATAERHLARQLDRKAQTMRRRGFDTATIKIERDRAETAIRALLVRTVFEGSTG